jgi:hypothetical protein
MKMRSIFLALIVLGLAATMAGAALEVPTDIQQPGTQPQEVGNLESPDKCDNCHGGYNSSVEPAHNWRGSMMGNAGRDPIFWATVAVAEQDFDGAGDLCIRCHSTGGWLAGRSTPTDGSGLAAGDSDGVECDFCHKVTNPDNCELQGVMFDPFIANDADSPACALGTGYYGSGITSMWGGSEKLGPYSDAEARHQFMQSSFHRSVDFCGMCHDVSNPAVGDLAPGNGTQSTADPVVFNGILGGPVAEKAAFNNFPYQYGVVERTFSEYKAGVISQTLISDYVGLPSDLQGGALEAIYTAAQASGTGGNYEDGDPRYYSCQSCHMRPVTGIGCNKKGAPNRTDLPLHDMTGGNYWMPEAIKHLDTEGKLRLGGGLTATQLAAMDDGALRANQQLNLAASLTVTGNTVKVINHTGHKLISGYPEGRRMWLNIKWYDASNNPLGEDGEYGWITVNIDGTPTDVKTILDLHPTNTKIYEAHYGMTQDWASGLLALHPADLVLSYDRITGATDLTLGELAGSAPGTEHETFHFVLNNMVVKDNRIPPYGMDYEEARKRNALPVPADQYGGTLGGTYDYFDEVSLNPPSGAKSATIDLLYQPTSWEYIQFLYLANNGLNAFLANEGAYMLEAWLNTGMAEPYVMASATWRSEGGECSPPAPTLLSATPGNSQVTLTWQEIPGDPSVLGYRVYYDQAGKAQLVTELLDPAANQHIDTDLTNGQEYCYKVTSLYDCDGDEVFDLESAFSNILCAVPTNPGQTLFAGVDTIRTGKWVKEGKGKNATTTFELTQSFTAGDGVVIQARAVNEDLVALRDATVEISIKDTNGDTLTTLLTGPSDADGWAEATWQTQKPNKKGRGGTPPGVYSAETTGVTVSGYVWDSVMTSTTFCIDDPSCTP